MSKFVRSLDRKAIEGAKRASSSDPAFAKQYPALLEYLTLTTLNGDPRETSRLSLFAEEGVFKAFLNDPHTGSYVCVSHKTIMGLLDVLEKALASGDADWRVSRTQKRK